MTEGTVTPGTLVGGRFRIEEPLGEGGMAEVFRVTDIATSEPMALKLLKPEVSSQPEAVERVRREGELLRELEHPAVVRVETFGQTDDGRIFIVMELLRGETLGTRMRRDGPIGVQALLPIVTGTCAGLSAAHERGIVHRDLKPDNVFLADTGGAKGEVQVKLLDFGIAKVTGKDRITQTGEVVGTPRYMAPEQLAADRDLDARTDIYALGVILFEALAGKPPFLAMSPTDLIVDILHGKHAPLRSYRPDLAPAVGAVVARAMTRAKEARYASATELAEAFVDAVGRERPLATPPPRSARDGVATAFMGSIGASGVASEPGERDLRTGTFSELERVDPGVTTLGSPSPSGAPASNGENEGSRALLPTLPAISIGPSGPAEERAIEAAPPRKAATRAGAESERAHAATPPASATSSPPRAKVADPVERSSPPPERERPSRERRRSSGPDSTDPSAYRLPTRRNRTTVIVAGLFSGALSAGIAIVALSYFTRAPEPVPHAEHASGSASRPEAAALVRDARAALGAGDAARCVALADRALAAGADPTVHRLRGDCLLASGDRAAALESYRAFCRDAAGHPGIDEVRLVVEELGSTCP